MIFSAFTASLSLIHMIFRKSIVSKSRSIRSNLSSETSKQISASFSSIKQCLLLANLHSII